MQDDENNWVVTVDRLRAVIDLCSGVLPLDSIEIKPELGCGAAVFPYDANDVGTLLDNAIAAAAQATSSAPVVLHSKKARREAFKRLSIEQQMRRALERDEFFLCYQPVVNLQHGRVVGAEALIRWQTADQGLICPNTFIPAAEASGLITPIGRWVMHRACEQLREWNANGLSGMSLAINLSARQFLEPNLSADIANAIKLTGIDARQVEFELTETSAMQDIDYTRQMLAQLRDLGVTIAMDDFGTGYANLSYLRNLPFDKLKIDRSFVTDVHQCSDRKAICRSIIVLSQGLGIDVLAEGTGKAEEVHYLNAQGCNLFQGYFFAEPLAADEFIQACDALPTVITRCREEVYKATQIYPQATELKEAR